MNGSVSLVADLFTIEGRRIRRLAVYLGPNVQPVSWAADVVSHLRPTQQRPFVREQHAMLVQLGFTPAERSRLGLAEVKRLTVLDELRLGTRKP